MAGKPVGTIFVELDLDASRYTKGQQKLLKDSQATSLNIEQNFKNLGIKSSAEMDLMRAKIKNSFDMIANSSKSTANDIMRAEEAKNSKLKALNDKQFGEQKNHIESLKNNWLAYAASIYAAGRIINQSIEMATAGSKLEKQSASFVNLAEAAGTSSRKMLDDLKVVSRGMIAEAELIGAAGKALLMGIKPAEITKLMEIAAATSKMTGQSMTEAFADITMGVARQSRMILDNLGIIVDAEKAYADYARTLGKSAEALTDIEKRQAFMNAVVKSGDDMIKRLGASSGELEGVNKLIAAQANLWADVQKTVASMLDKELSGYAKVINWIDAKLKGMRSSAGEASMKDALKEIEMLRSLESKGMAQPGSTMNKQAEFNRRWGGGASEAELANQAAMQRYKAAEAAKFQGSSRVADNAIPYDVDARWKAFEEGLKKAAEEEKKVAAEAMKAAEEVKKLHDEVQKLESDFSSAKDYGGEASNYERMQAQLRSGAELANMEYRRGKVLEDQRRAMQKADQELSEQNWWKTYIDDVEDAARANEMFKDTMDIMSQSFADAFAGFVVGTKSAKEAFQGMVQSVIAGMVRMATQSTSEQLMGLLFKTGTSLASAYFGGSTPTGMGTNTQFAGGGTVGSNLALVKHSGGLVDGTGPRRQVSSWMFANAPRLHEGLAPDEYPAILQRGERVVKKGGHASNNNITINVAAPGGSMSRESLATLQASLFTTLQRAGSRNT